MQLKNFTKFMTLMMGLLFASTVFSQTAIYEFTFDMDLDGWTTVGISSSDPDSAANAVWVWAEGGETMGDVTGGLTIASTSGGGAVVFDSDYLDNGGNDAATASGTGSAPGPQRGELISPLLDFTDDANVYLSFSQYYIYFSKDGDNDFDTPASSIEVSTDSGATWTSWELNTGFNPFESTGSGDVEVLDLTDMIAGEDSVMVKFVWDGYYYFWILDDIAFYNEKGQDLSILQFTVPDNFETPDFLFEGDTISMEVMFTNFGDATVDSVELRALIFDEEFNFIYGDTALFSDENGDAIPVEPGDTSIWIYDNPYIGEMLASSDRYRLIYSIRSYGDTIISEVLNPSDNVDGSFFGVSDFELNKTPGGSGTGFNGSGNTGEYEDFAFGNIFVVPETLTENLSIEQVHFECFGETDATTGQGEPLSDDGKTILAYVIKFPDSVKVTNGTILAQESSINFDASLDLDAMTEDGYVIGIGSYTFTTDDGSSGRFTVDVVDFEEGSGPVVVEPGFTYMVAISYKGDASRIVQEVNRTYNLYQLSTFAYYPMFNQWVILSSSSSDGTTSPYYENIAVIDVTFGMPTDINEVQLPEESVSVYPNPTSELINVDLTFENATDVNIFILDLNGKILSMDGKKGIQSFTKAYNVNGLPSGAYLVRIQTAEGAATKRFVKK